MTPRAAARLAPVVAGLLALSACLGRPGAGGAPEKARPTELSYRPAAAPSQAFAGARELAGALSGTYVHVVIVDSREVGAGRDAQREPGIVTGASGAIVDARGWVVTTAHVATSAELEARVITADGRTREADVVAVAPQRELALIKMSPYPGMQTARLGDSAALRAGDPVLAIGTPDNRRGVVFQGRVKNPRRAQRIQYGEFGYDDAVELELDAEPGNSGGPLFNRAGELVGIIASFSLGNTNPGDYAPTQLAWAVPSNAIAAYLREVAGR